MLIDGYAEVHFLLQVFFYLSDPRLSVQTATDWIVCMC